MATEYLQIANKFYESYEVIFERHLEVGKKEFLGDKNPRNCRFCGMSKEDVTFRKDAHAFPESSGNKSLFTYYECDSCNDLFGRTIEDDFGKYFVPDRILEGLRGKRGHPSLKDEIEGWRIGFKDDRLEISHIQGKEVAEIYEDKNQLSISLTRQKYTQIAVYKAFVKMALSVLPEAEVNNFPEAIAWVREEDLSKVLVRPAYLLVTFVPGPRPFPVLTSYLLKRKSDDADVPYITFVLAHGNYVYQIFVPCPRKDSDIENKEIKLTWFPTSYEFTDYPYGLPKRLHFNLESSDPVAGEKVTRVMHFDSAELVQKTEAGNEKPDNGDSREEDKESLD